MARRKEKDAAAHAGLQACAAMRQSHADTLIKAGDPARKIDNWWYYQEHAVRMARLAAYHAFKARPELKPLDSYATAVMQYRAANRAAVRA